MREDIKIILHELHYGFISLEVAEEQVNELIEALAPNAECICCYMTTGEHSTNCPKYLEKYY